MEILNKEQIDDLFDCYEYKDTVESFVKKTLNKFPLTEEELVLIFKMIDKAAVEWF